MYGKIKIPSIWESLQWSNPKHACVGILMIRSTQITETYCEFTGLEEMHKNTDRVVLIEKK